MTADPEVLLARRAFPQSQRLLAAEPTSRVAGAAVVGWYDQLLDPEIGAFAMVRPDGKYAALVGEILRVSTGVAEVYVYVHRSANAEQDLVLCRRAFFELGDIWRTTHICLVEML